MNESPVFGPRQLHIFDASEVFGRPELKSKIGLRAPSKLEEIQSATMARKILKSDYGAEAAQKKGENNARLDALASIEKGGHKLSARQEAERNRLTQDNLELDQVLGTPQLTGGKKSTLATYGLGGVGVTNRLNPFAGAADMHSMFLPEGAAGKRATMDYANHSISRGIELPSKARLAAEAFGSKMLDPSGLYGAAWGHIKQSNADAENATAAKGLSEAAHALKQAAGALQKGGDTKMNPLGHFQ